MTKRTKNRLSPEVYADGILKGDRFMLSRAITVIESNHPSDMVLAQQIMEAILPHTGNAVRLGVTGVPGAGKSTFIEALGQELTSEGLRIAVLAIDPSSPKFKGSIMGDKTRMEDLAHDPLAYIRPSPTGSNIGGVARKTRETMLLCEAAGFEVIIIETVGVGQSEVAVKSMVDFFLLLMLAGAGDELQGIKKGIMEMADGIVINKADGKNIEKAKMAQREYQNALRLFRDPENGWACKVLTCSAIEKTNIREVWKMITKYKNSMWATGWINKNRSQQNLDWLQTTIQDQLLTDFYQHEKVRQRLKELSVMVEEGSKPVIASAKELLTLYKKS